MQSANDDELKKELAKIPKDFASPRGIGDTKAVKRLELPVNKYQLGANQK
jgi:hypothetical protein